MLTPYYPTPTTLYAHMLWMWVWNIQTTPEMLIDWQPKQRTRLADRDLPPPVNSTPPSIPSTFPLTFRESNSQSPLKRHRSETDVDGEGSVDLQKKKRRLRLDLVTSRLSQPYATPTTHIISRKSRRPGAWTSPRISIRSPLRRAAILNAIRIKRMPAKPFGPREVDLLTGLKFQKESDHTEVDLITHGVRTPQGSVPNEDSPQQPPPPLLSPLGPSNYEALDEYDDPYDVDEEESIGDEDSVYSNFNDLDGEDADIEDYDTPYQFGGEEEPYRPWTPEVISQPTDLKTGISQQVETLQASCAS
ncbi:MAG: hypothetical protein Q9188_006590 [Gyalolechia gomerana]